MVRPSSSLQVIASSALRAQRVGPRPRQQPISFEDRQQRQLQLQGQQAGDIVQQAARCILLHDIPRPALPSDIERALKASGAVDSSFSSSSITTLPPSLPKAPSLYRTVHITLPSHKKAVQLSTTLSTRPIFSSGRPVRSRSRTESASASASASAQFGEISADGTSSEGISGSGNGNASTTKRDLSTQAQLTHVNSTSWTSNIIAKTFSDRSNPEKDQQQSHSVQKTFTPEWSMRSGLRGRRVIIQGLPLRISLDEVKRLGKDCGVVQDMEGCMRLPS
nr:uncharacterized protein I303_08345 [Kwoniella dejecticola CBS 10117]OBR81575.1 hypothetical protein I303_08345 [Kwoniella dejecticola CBS 10117]